MDSGLLNKRDELSVLIQKRDPDVMVFNEVLPKRTRKKKKIQHKDFEIEGYDFLLRSTVEGRGVIVYFKQLLTVYSVDFLISFNFEESLWVRIKLKGCDTLLVGNIYRSPSSTYENNLKLNELLRKAMELKDSHILLMGDFNYGGLNWEFLQSSEHLEHSSTLFMEKIYLFLYQHVDRDTRHWVGQSPLRLDLLFTNEIGMISELDRSTLPPLGASDHCCLLFKFACYTKMRKSETPRPNFYKGDYPSMKKTFQDTDWSLCENEH